MEPQTTAEEEEKRDEEAAAAAIVRHMYSAAMCVAADAGKQRSGPRASKRGGTIDEPQFDWLRHEDQLKAYQFKRRYRVTKDAFHRLLGKIAPHLPRRNAQKASASRRAGAISNEVKLAVTLRMLAGAAADDLWHIYRPLSRGSVYMIFWECVHAIEVALPCAWNSVGAMKDPELLKMLEARARARSRKQVWAGQVGALDGVIFKQKDPGNRDGKQRRHHVARKDMHGILCQAIADVDRRILWFNMSYVGTTHDSLAFEGTALGQAVYNGELPAPYFLGADNAYVQTDSVIGPGGGSDYDFEQSSNRMTVECTFGILVRRWGVLWRPLEFDPDRRTAVISACIRLHNFCTEERLDTTDLEDLPIDAHGRVEVSEGRWRQEPVFDREGRPVQYLDTGATPAPHRAGVVLKRRQELVDAVHDAGLKRVVRPKH